MNISLWIHTANLKTETKAFKTAKEQGDVSLRASDPRATAEKKKKK